MSRRPRRAIQPVSRYAPQASPMAPAPPYVPPSYVSDTYRPDLPQVPLEGPGMDPGASIPDPAMVQAIQQAGAANPIPDPNFLRPPNPADAQYAPNGFLERWAQNTGGQNPFAQYQGWQPSSPRGAFGQALLASLATSLGSNAYNQGLRGVQQKQSAYQAALAGTEAQNQALSATATEASKQRLATIQKLLDAKAMQGIKAPTTSGATKFPLDPRLASAMRKFGIAPPTEATAGEQQDFIRQYAPELIPRATSTKTPLESADILDRVQKDVRGNQYLPYEDWTGEDRKVAMRVARENGIPSLNKVNAAAITELDKATLNNEALKESISQFPPQRDVLGRIRAIGQIKWAELVQSDPNIASYSALQLAAIQNIKAIAGGQGSGVRINQAEISRSLANDIPRDTDNLPTALRKLANVNRMLENNRTAIMVKDRSQLLKPITRQPVNVVGPNGETGTADAGHPLPPGWRIAP